MNKEKEWFLRFSFLYNLSLNSNPTSPEYSKFFTALNKAHHMPALAILSVTENTGSFLFCYDLGAAVVCPAFADIHPT